MRPKGLMIVGLMLAFSVSLSLGIRRKSVHGAPSSQSAITIPWPWMRGGATWQRPGFSATPYPVQEVPDSTIPQGQWLLLHPGQRGITYAAGTERSVILPAKPETLAKGTAVVHQLNVNGQVYDYDRVLTMVTTAYNGSFSMNGPWGAVAAWDGKPLAPGDVAVDPSVIPLGTYLYIDGYGPARAVDTGSAIVGNHVDLFFNESAWQIALYGIHFRKVYILTKKPPNFSG